MVKVGLIPFDEQSLPLAQQITQEMYKADCTSILRKVLSNPIHCQAGATFGELALQEGDVVGFQATIIRKLYYQGKPFLGVVGSTLCMRPDASPVLLMQLMRATIASRAGSRLFYSNTANFQSMKMNQLLNVKGVGPASCGETRFAILNAGSFLRLATRGWLPAKLAIAIDMVFRIFARRAVGSATSRVMSFDVLFARFWQRYLDLCHGLVSSRSCEELNWAFGEEMLQGKVIVLAHTREGNICGYIVLSARDKERRKWRVADWIALGNDLHILDDLLASGIRYLKYNTQAAILELVGFNISTREIVARNLRFKRVNSNNSFIYTVTDKDMADKMTFDTRRDWFWGPYDGDRCLV